MLHSIKMLLLICVLSVSAHAITVRNLVNQDGTVTKPVIEILGQAGVRIKGAEANPEWPPMQAELDSADCQKVSDLLQGQDTRYPSYSWFRGNKTERWDMKYELPDANLKKILALVLEFGGLDMGASVSPASKAFDGVILLGTTLGDFKQRVQFLNELIDVHQVKIGGIYILTGKREFNEQEKKLLQSQDATGLLLINNEKEGMEWILNHEKSNALLKFTLIVIDDASPTGMRATTESTVKLFFDKVKPSDGKRYLAVSSHIFTLYQYLILKRVAFEKGYKNVSFEIGGTSLQSSERNSLPPEVKLAIALDNLARIFYEICQYKTLTGEYPN